MPRRASKQGDYAVGYGKLPAAHRFKPGQSGNPRGRPKGVPSPHAALAKIMNVRMEVTENGVRRRYNRMEVLLLKVMQQAMKGDRHSTKQLLDLSREAANASREEVLSPAAEAGIKQPPAVGFAEMSTAQLSAIYEAVRVIERGGRPEGRPPLILPPEDPGAEEPWCAEADEQE